LGSFLWSLGVLDRERLAIDIDGFENVRVLVCRSGRRRLWPCIFIKMRRVSVLIRIQFGQ